MKKINTLQQLKYRKLFLRTEIMVMEERVKRQFGGLKDQIKSPEIKNSLVKGLMNNPALVINIARLSYNLVKRWKQRKRKRNLREDKS
jgi:hypothetical protein